MYVHCISLYLCGFVPVKFKYEIDEDHIDFKGKLWQEKLHIELTETEMIV